MQASSSGQKQDKGALLFVEDLAVEYHTPGGLLSARKRPVRAVDGVDLAVCCGETLGVVGESGCGKTSLGRALVRLVPPVRGRILVDDVDILALRGQALRRFRPNIQMIFQNPASSLDPRMRVFDLVAEPLRAHFKLNSAELTARIRESLDQVGIHESQWYRHPSALSGGQAQRVAIARVLVMNPRIVVLDEPTSALDVSVQAQVVNLLRRLQRERGLTYLYISHDLALVDHLSDRIAVMYLGQIVEIAGRAEILNAACHPYTQALLSASPVADPDRKRGRIVLGGTVPDPASPPPGCRFHPRCPAAMEACQHSAPRMVAVSDSHLVACHLLDDCPAQASAKADRAAAGALEAGLSSRAQGAT